MGVSDFASDHRAAASRRKILPLAGALLCLALLACGGQRTASGPGIEDAVSGGPPQQPPWPGAQASSLLTETLLDGVSVYAKSANAVEQGTALELGSQAGNCEWAIYRFDPGAEALDSVAVLLDIPEGSAAWIGLADYARQAWSFCGPHAQSKTLAVDESRFRSATGALFLSVVVYGGDSATVQSLGVRTIRPENQDPWAELTADVSTGNAPLSVSFDAGGSIDPDGEIRYYMWDFNGDGNYEAMTFSPATAYTYTAPGVFSATVAAVDDSGGWGTATAEITVAVQGNASPVADLVATPGSGDAPLAVQLEAGGSSDADGSIVRYDYDFDSDGIWDAYDAGDSVEHTYTIPGDFTAKLRVTDNAGAQAIDTVLVDVWEPGNAEPQADLTADKRESYVPYTISFDASGSSDNDGTIVKYEWDFDGDGSYEEYGPSATTTYTYPVRGTYLAQVRVTDDDGAQDSAEYAITLPTAWWMFGMEATHNRRSPYIGAQTNNVKWSYTLGAIVLSSPAIGVDGTVYVASYDNKLCAIKPNGIPKWTYTTGGFVASSPALAADGTIYFGSFDNKLYALKPDGTLKWAYTTGHDVFSSPAIAADGTVYVGSYDGYFYAINPDGSLKWSHLFVQGVYSSPAIAADGTVYVVNFGWKLFALNPDGTLKWSYSMAGPAQSSPAIAADGTVYVGDLNGHLIAVNPNGSLKWSYTMGGEVYSSPAIAADGTVYVGSYDDNLYAINPDGSLKWSYAVGDGVYSSPAIDADGTIYVGSLDDNVYAINPDSSLKWSYTTGGDVQSSPAIAASGTVYVGSGDSKLYAFGPP